MRSVADIPFKAGADRMTCLAGNRDPGIQHIECGDNSQFADAALSKVSSSLVALSNTKLVSIPKNNIVVGSKATLKLTEDRFDIRASVGVTEGDVAGTGYSIATADDIIAIAVKDTVFGVDPTLGQ